MSELSRSAAGDLSPSALVERMLSVTSELTDVVVRETASLEARDTLKATELQPHKTALANEYAMDVQAIVLNHGLIDRVPAGKVAELKAAMTKLDEALRTNGLVLAAAKSVSERLLKSIAATVNERKAPTLGYGRNAAIARPVRGTGGAIAIDARF